jgi:peptidoglycan/xylan/chitin deacetylase (PgdA/CDA1 family)
MFFDAASPRVLVILAIAGMLGTATFYTTRFWFENRPLERAVGEAIARETSNATYWLRFKLPDLALAAIGSAGAADTPAQTPPTGMAESVPVLLYHGESGGPTMSLATFVAQMRALHGAGWRTITMSQFEKFMRGEASVPDKSFLLTFDDGRTDTFYPADPVLRDLGYTAVMFVITGLSLPENSDTAVNSFYLNKSELSYMRSSGRWELASHGKTDHAGYAVPSASSTADNLQMLESRHFLSNKFWLPIEQRLETEAEYRSRIEEDLRSAKETLMSDFGIPVTGYAYPFNDFGQESVNFPAATSVISGVVRSLYDYAFYQTWAGNGDSFNYPDPRGYLVKRIEPLASWSGSELLAIVDGGRAKPLPYYNAGPFGKDWQTNWGSVSSGNTLRLAATDSTSGAATFLDGTEGWRDYTLSASVTITHGTISLIARHAETDMPYLVCAFSSDHIYLEKHASDTQVTVASAHYAPPALPGTYRVTMRVAGSEASCGAYGVTVRARIPDVSSRGGIGVSIWHPQNGHADASLTSLSASSL